MALPTTVAKLVDTLCCRSVDSAYDMALLANKSIRHLKVVWILALRAGQTVHSPKSYGVILQYSPQRTHRQLSVKYESLTERSAIMLDRITFDPRIMGGRACVRGMRITVAHIVNLVANGMSVEQIMNEHPDLEAEDVRQALSYAALLTAEELHPLTAAV